MLSIAPNSTTVDLQSQQLCFALPNPCSRVAQMKMGKRLAKELKDREMRPVDLCEIVAALADGSILSDGTISALINRDSGNSKFAPAIAKALDLELHWLLTGEEPKYLQGSSRSKNYITRGLPATGLLSARDGLLADWDALPESWRFSISKRARLFREVADKLSPDMLHIFRAIPDESSYWQWERGIDAFVKNKLGIIEDGGYIGPEQRQESVQVNEEKRTNTRAPSKVRQQIPPPVKRKPTKKEAE